MLETKFYPATRPDGKQWQINERAKAVIDLYGGKVMPYRELPKESQLAMAHYMAIDGEAWDCPDILYHVEPRTKKFEKLFLSARKQFVREHGEELFGLVNLPLEVLTLNIYQCTANGEDWDEKTVQQFIENCDKNYDKNPNKHKISVWPVILGCDTDMGFIQDGWNRFGSYLDNKIKTVPCLWYPHGV